MNALYRNANGKQYRILRMVGDVALLESVIDEDFGQYIVAISFSPYIDSWGQGEYFKSLDKAREKFDSITD